MLQDFIADYRRVHSRKSRETMRGHSGPHKGGDLNYRSPIYRDNKNHGTYSSGSRVYAGLYFGYSDGLSVSRVGVDGAFVQDFFQNRIHRIIGSPYFNTNYGPSTRLFQQTYSYHAYSLY